MAVVEAGVTELKTSFPADQYSGILVAYMRGLKIVFGIGIGSCGMAFIIIVLLQR